MAINVTINKKPLYGTVYWDGTKFVYTPNQGFTGKDYYIYTTVENGVTKVLTNYVDIVNQPPTAGNITLSGNTDDDLKIDVTPYISDPDNLVAGLKVVDISEPYYGRAWFKDNIIYYKSHGFDATDSIIYTISDGQYQAAGSLIVTTVNGSMIRYPNGIMQQLTSLEATATIISVESGKWESAYTTLCANSAQWMRINAFRYDSAATVVEANSSNWNAVFSAKPTYDNMASTVAANSGYWLLVSTHYEPLSTIFFNNSANWISTYTTICAKSASWEQGITDLYNLTNAYSSNSGNWDSAYNTVCSYSASWDKTQIISILTSYSADWNTAYVTTRDISGLNESARTILSALSTDYITYSGNWQTAYLTTQQQSGVWSDLTALCILTAGSGNWNSVYFRQSVYDSMYTVLCANTGNWQFVAANFAVVSSEFQSQSARWDDAYNTLKASSGRWENSNNDIVILRANYNTNSAYWDSTYTTVCGYSASWDTASLFNYVSSNSGNWTGGYNTLQSSSGSWETAKSTLDQLSTNYAQSSGNWETAYTTVCSFSSTWDITPIKNVLLINSGYWDTNYQTVCALSANWTSSGTTLATISTQYATNSGNWETTYTTVCANSGNWNIDTINNLLCANSGNWQSVYDQKSLYDAGVSYINSNQSSWNSVATAFAPVSAQFQAYSAAWISTYNVVCANSAGWNDSVTQIGPLYSNYNVYSGSWSDTYNILCGYSAAWDTTPITNLLRAKSGDWYTSYTIICANSSKWDNSLLLLTALSTNFSSSTGVWDTTTNIVCTYSAFWNENTLRTLLCANSANWSSVYRQKSAYDSTYNTVCAYSGLWTNVFTVICANSAAWDTKTITTILSVNSGLWSSVYRQKSAYDSTYNTVCAYSGMWTNAFTVISANSAKWDVTSLTNILSVNSGLWSSVYQQKSAYDSTYNTVCTYSAAWKTASDIVSSTYNTWDIRTLGTIISSNSANWNTLYYQMSVINNGLNTLTANSGNWDQVYTILSAHSAEWDVSFLTSFLSTNSGYWQKMLLRKDSYDTAYYSVCSLSSSWQTAYTTMVDNSAYWGTTLLVSLLTSGSSNWNSSYSIVSSNSANWQSSASIFKLLSTDYAQNSGNWDSTYNTVCSFSSYWDNSNVAYTIISTYSAGWEDVYKNKGYYDVAYTILTANSALWYDPVNNISITNLVANNSSKWSNAFNLVTAGSANWNQNIIDVLSVANSYQTYSGGWQIAYNYIKTTSGNWDNANLVSIVYGNSGNWTDSYIKVSETSGNWNNTYSYLTSINADYSITSATWDSTYTTVCAYSGYWSSLSDVTTLSANSGYWTSVYNTICAFSGYWNSLSAIYDKYNVFYTVLTANTGGWAVLTNIISGNSGAWVAPYNLINSNSARWLSGSSAQDYYANNLYVASGAIVYGTLSALGQIVALSTSSTSPATAFNIYNTGFTDALVVTKTQLSGALGTFTYNGSAVLYIDPNNKVGINTSLPNKALTVVGDISATGMIYGFTPPEFLAFNTMSATYEAAAAYLTLSGSNINSIFLAKVGYDSTDTYVRSVCDSVNNFFNVDKPLYDSAYATTVSQTGTLVTSYTFLNANSSKIGIDTLFRSKSSSYDSAYSYIRATSGTIGSSQLNFVFDGGGDVVASGSTGVIQIPAKVLISSWSLMNDKAATVYIEVLSSTFANYPVFDRISGDVNTNADYIKTNKYAKNSSSTLTNWKSIVEQDTILKFNLLVNDNAGNITISLKCIKI